MLNQKWSNSLFLLTTMAGTITALSATNWIAMYIGMELNLFAFIPLMMKTPNNKEREAATKYFLVQTLGSLLLLTSATWLNSTMTPNLPKLMLIASLMIKAGAAPLHFWFPNVMSGLSWHLCLLLSTWQKLFPLLFLFNSLATPRPQSLLIIFIIGAMVGSIGGLNQTSLRGLLAYSSISHMGWMLSASLFSPLCASLYLSIYIASTSTIILSLAPWSNLDTQKMTSQLPLPTPHKIAVSTLFLSLAGLPPLLGFLPKWQIVDQLTSSAPWCIPPLLIASITALFFYLKISFYILLAPNWDQSTPPSLPIIPSTLTLFILNMPILLPLFIL